MLATILHYLIVALIIYLAVTLRTLIIGGAFFVYFYGPSKSKVHHRKFNPVFPKLSVMAKEFNLSMKATLSFVVWDLLAYHFYLQGNTLIYTDVDQYGLWYLPVSLLLLMLVHDFYFYWTHRYMHKPAGRWIKHSTHHQFHNPTIWSAFAVSMPEAMVQMFFHLIVVFILPLHPLVIGAYFITSFTSNCVGHSGYKVGSTDTKFFSNSSNHFHHHKHSQCHFGLYFNVWDKLMSTELK